MNLTETLSLAGSVLQRDPFLHMVIPDCMSERLAESLLTWFEEEAEWKSCAIDDFYQLSDIDLRSAEIPEDLRILVDSAFLEDLRNRVAHFVNAHFSSKIDVTAHKMMPGCRIRVHNDHGDLGQTHRLLVHLNRGWTTENGGLLMLFDEEHPSLESSNLKCYLPHHRRAIGFEISPKSFHAVSTVTTGDRYALCFSFYGH